MVADRTKKLKVSEKGENLDEIDGELVLSIEKLQEIQDELEKVPILIFRGFEMILYYITLLLEPLSFTHSLWWIVVFNYLFLVSELDWIN